MPSAVSTVEEPPHVRRRIGEPERHHEHRKRFAALVACVIAAVSLTPANTPTEPSQPVTGTGAPATLVVVPEWQTGRRGYIDFLANRLLAGRPGASKSSSFPSTSRLS